MVTSQDKIQLKGKGITEEQLEYQLGCFRTGFPYLRLYAAATQSKGISVPTENERNELVHGWDEYRSQEDVSIVKFVPASGAASRMFKNLYAFLEGESNVPKTDFERKFFDNIRHFAFYEDLDEACKRINNMGIAGLVKAGNFKAVVKALLDNEGLGYGSKPKGVLLFHSYPDGARTPLEEHLYEGALIASDSNKCVKVHFTVSPEHKDLFREHVERPCQVWKKRWVFTSKYLFRSKNQIQIR